MVKRKRRKTKRIRELVQRREELRKELVHNIRMYGYIKEDIYQEFETIVKELDSYYN